MLVRGYELQERHVADNRVGPRPSIDMRTENHIIEHERVVAGAAPDGRMIIKDLDDIIAGVAIDNIADAIGFQLIGASAPLLDGAAPKELPKGGTRTVHCELVPEVRQAIVIEGPLDDDLSFAVGIEDDDLGYRPRRREAERVVLQVI